MSKAAHTPTPWKAMYFTTVNDTVSFLYAVQIKSEDNIILYSTHNNAITEDVFRANTGLIITAVNHHHELVTRLKKKYGNAREMIKEKFDKFLTERVVDCTEVMTTYRVDKIAH